MNDKQIIDMLLNRETEISNKFHNAITEILRLSYETDRGKEVVNDLIESVKYTLEETERIVSRFSWIATERSLYG